MNKTKYPKDIVNLRFWTISRVGLKDMNTSKILLVPWTNSVQSSRCGLDLVESLCIDEATLHDSRRKYYILMPSGKNSLKTHKWFSNFESQRLSSAKLARTNQWSLFPAFAMKKLQEDMIRLISWKFSSITKSLLSTFLSTTWSNYVPRIS